MKEIAYYDLAIERETKRTVRYSDPSGTAGVDTLYIQKAALPTPFPERLRIVVGLPPEDIA